MANLRVNNFHFLKIHLNNAEYWDFYVDRDGYNSYKTYNGEKLYDGCLVSNIDMSNENCYSANTILSDAQYTWEDAFVEDTILYNIGYTGVDNGLFTYKKDRITNQDFYDIFTKSKYTISSGDTRLILHKVDGNTLRYDYPSSVEDGVLCLNGGFYQGFFMTKCDEYRVLPKFGEQNDIYNFEFTLKKCNLKAESTNTLNDSHPNNKGIFFYIGTRAENKFIYWYDKNDKEGLESDVQFGIGDFVEDGEIDKNEYGLDSFYDLNPDFTEEDFIDDFQLGDYTDYSYYDNDKYYNPYEEECIITDLELCDYVECKRPYAKLKPIFEWDNIEHETLDYCQCSYTKETTHYKYVKFFRGCGCGFGYRKEEIVDTEVTNDNVGRDTYVFSYDNEYIDNFDDLEYEVDYLESEVSLGDFEYETENGFTFSETKQYYFMTDNKFLMFDRTKSGHKANNWVEGTKIMYYGRKRNYKGNLFLLLNRTPTGYNITNIDELLDEDGQMSYNPYADLYNNALAFRITDDGKIGYRYLTLDCSISGENKTKIEEGYSKSGLIKDCQWQDINVRMEILNGKMKFQFYIDGRLVYITKWLDKLKLRALDDIDEKQEGVPYNISLGGGSQGLCDVIQQNYMIESTRVYPIEEYFAGSFIGYIKNFRIYNCQMGIDEIKNNFLFDSKNWNN